MSIDKTHGMSYNIVNEIGITYSGETEMNSPDNGVITSPLSGKAVKLENVPDPTFAQGILQIFGYTCRMFVAIIIQSIQ